ncbi:MAG TPA: metallophosphoesterase [Lachnospiraceae bacterium]|nr:metallophosphoesterase [Lachnospiraceae bacterium]
MKILIISDTHRKNEIIPDIISAEAPIDMLIHCGDIEGDINLLLPDAPFPIQIVGGNMDRFYSYDSESVFKLGYYTVYLTHGHLMDVLHTNQQIKVAANKVYADILIYGHTHMSEIIQEDELLIINPGSLTEPRQSGRQPSYAVLSIDDDTYEHECVIKYL